MKIIALMGKAGSGKDTLLKHLIQQYPGRYNEIISCTTRPQRENEKDGVNYYFLTLEEFTQRLLSGDLLEAVEFNGWHYGTAYSTLAKNKINVGVFNPDGVACLMEDPNLEVEIIHIKCPHKERLLRQLNREKDPDVTEIVRRFSADEEDFSNIETRFSFTEFDNVTPEDIDKFIHLFGQLY